MTSHTYDKATTALLVIDPYNDFLSEGGKVWPRVKDVATEIGLLDNLRAISSAVRSAGIQIFIVPHRPDFAPRDGDIIIKEHWGSSGFANTDLDLQLKQHGISHVILVGLLANTCTETTGRYAQELGYHVTLIRDATAAYTKEMMHAAHELNGPTYAHAILNTGELIAALPQA
jgi:nicotinamidase-related amidase